jgi:ABC-type phosphate transport system substrate-binding protein
LGGFPWNFVLAVVGIVVPIIAFGWEFAVAGRKRLGYRVQLDTPITNGSHSDQVSSYANALDLLGRENGTPLLDPSLVLVRIENSGTTHIDSTDYALAHDKVGMHINFPGRRVAGMVVTEFSADFIAENFGRDSALAKREIIEAGRPVGVIDLPRTPLNRAAHFKVLALLERADREQLEVPRVVGGIKGGVGNGGVRKTRARTGLSWWTTLMICLLAVTVIEVGRSAFFGPAPLDCAAGRLTLVGSTAFAPVVQEAADSYARRCPGADFAFDFNGSVEGLRALDGAGGPDMLAFSDGAKGDGLPQLLPRPAAFSLFSLVANKEAGVQDLSLDQIRQLYDGRITNWSEIGGTDMPVRLVSRAPDSGTRRTFQQQLLDGRREPGSNSDDCLNPDPGAPPGVVRCERSSTTDLLNAVAGTPGALGYSELSAASAAGDVLLVRIDGQGATLDGAAHNAYPFWQTEIAYTHGEPAADSLAASFLRYLTNEVGRDIVRSYGLRPCAELENPVLCRPT